MSTFPVTRLRRLRRTGALPALVLLTDVCLCEYTVHGHCGVLRAGSVAGEAGDPRPEDGGAYGAAWGDGEIDNDSTLDLLARTAVSQVEAGADAVCPSDMMD